MVARGLYVRSMWMDGSQRERKALPRAPKTGNT